MPGYRDRLRAPVKSNQKQDVGNRHDGGWAHKTAAPGLFQPLAWCSGKGNQKVKRQWDPWWHTDTEAAVTTQQDAENTREKPTALETGVN